MRIAIGTDHRGDAAGATLAEHLRQHGHDVEVLGSTGSGSRDYPDLAYLVGRAVSEGRADRGILLCGSGIGMSIAANKVPGIRAALAHDVHAAEMSRRHNDANVLCLDADRTSLAALRDMADRWLVTTFEGGRHARRVEKITAIERGEDPITGSDRATERPSDRGDGGSARARERGATCSPN